jgi:hypothetical protein
MRIHAKHQPPNIKALYANELVFTRLDLPVVPCSLIGVAPV